MPRPSISLVRQRAQEGALRNTIISSLIQPKVLHEKQKELLVVGISNVSSGRKVPSGRTVNILIFQQRSHKYSQESIGFGNLDVRVKLWVEIISH